MNDDRNTYAPNATILDYRGKDISRNVRPQLFTITGRGCALSVLGLLLCILISVLLLWKFDDDHRRAEMRQYLPAAVAQWADKPAAQYEVTTVFSGAATRFYRVKASPDDAQKLISEFSKDAVHYSPGGTNVGEETPDWWRPNESQDIREFDGLVIGGRSEVRVLEKYWISPSNGWVYMYVPGH